MAQTRAPRLTQEECEQFLEDVRTRNPRADVLLRAYLDYCRSIALKKIKEGKVHHRPPGKREKQSIYLPHAILRELQHVNGSVETTAQVGHNAKPGTGAQHAETANEWVEEIAHDAILIFVRHVRTGCYNCRGYQVTTYLYDVVVNTLLKTATKIDLQLKRGEVYGLPLDLFGSGHDLSGTIYIDKRTKRASTGPQPQAGEQSQQQEPAIDPAASTSDEDHAVSGEDETEPPALDRLHPELHAVLELIAAEETRAAVWRCVEALPLRQRNLITLMLRDEKPTEMARRFGVTPPRITELKHQAFERLGQCLWRRTLLEHLPRMGHLVEDLDPSIGIHYARGLVDRNYGKRCLAGVRRALDTAEPALTDLIERLLADRRACGLDNRSLADLARLLSPAQQRALVLALWSTAAVVIDPKADKVQLKPSADGRGYRAPDELPPV
jgi:DNA-directed RNA polymerase specialized sigma24 family protein